MSFLNVEVNYVCSLGPLCHTANILKRNDIKLCSYPFDWIFSNTDIISHCVEDDFKIFLDKSYYKELGDWQCAHTHYHPCMFNHHNPLNHEPNYSYFKRCVNRFKDLIKKPEHKLFIMTFLNMGEFDENFKNSIKDFKQKFDKHVSNYTLLVIFHRPYMSQHHEFTLHENIHFLELHATSHSGGVFFMNDEDNVYLDNILHSAYKFNIKNDLSTNE